jgi:hypothetical protein
MSSKLYIQQQQQQKNQEQELQIIENNSINNSIFSKTSSKKSPVLLTSFRYQSFSEDLNPSLCDLVSLKDEISYNDSDDCTFSFCESRIDLNRKEQTISKEFLPSLNKSKLNYFYKNNNYDIITDYKEHTQLNIDYQDNSIFLKKYALKRHHSAPQSDIKWLQVHKILSYYLKTLHTHHLLT